MIYMMVEMKYTELLCRDKQESYSDLVEKIIPDILIEDDCKSIGGEKQWCITGVKREVRDRIQSIIVEEFKGIDNIQID